MGDASDILTAAQLAEIEALRDEVDAAVKADGTLDDDTIEATALAIGKLLRHLRALTAPADGEALGREAWIGRADIAKWKMPPERVIEHMRASFDDQPEEEQARYQRIGLRCHAIGHTVGALSREGEIAALREDLEGERRAYAVRAETERTEIARLTAELVEARNVASRVVTEAIAEQAVTRAEDVATARADGAREERRLYMADLRGEIDNADERAFAVRVADRIERRALGDGSPAVTREPAPTRNDGPAIWPLLIAETQAGHYGGDTPEKRRLLEDMAERDRFGRERYGTPLQAWNGRDALVDAYQEALDLPVYLRQAQEEGRLSKYNGLVSNAVHLALCIRMHLDDADTNSRGAR